MQILNSLVIPAYNTFIRSIFIQMEQTTKILALPTIHTGNVRIPIRTIRSTCSKSSITLCQKALKSAAEFNALSDVFVLGSIGVTSKSPTQDVAVKPAESNNTYIKFLYSFIPNFNSFRLFLEIKLSSQYESSWARIKIIVYTIRYFGIDAVILREGTYILNCKIQIQIHITIFSLQ